MERLTERTRFRNAVAPGACSDVTCNSECNGCKIDRLIDRLAAYEDTGLETEEVMLYKEAQEISECMRPERLKELAQAERDGRLVVLHCNVGDVVYRPLVRDEGGYIIWEIRVCSINITRDHDIQSSDYAVGAVLPYNAGWTFDLSDIGKTVFLTRQEAEAAGERMEGEKAHEETDRA